MSAPEMTAHEAAAPTPETALVRVKNLSVSYRTDGSGAATNSALSGVDLDIGPGERLAVIGESGSGKSTLALALAGLLPAAAEIGGSIEWIDPHLAATRSFAPPSGLPAISPTRGEIGSFGVTGTPATSASGEGRKDSVISPLVGEMSGRTEGGNVESRPATNSGKRLALPVPGRDYGFVFQDPATSLDPVMPVGRQITEVARAHLGLTWRQAEMRARDLIARVRLPEPEGLQHAYPHELSGGQKQRVALACAIAAGPRLLIADEATSALDTIVQAQIVALIHELVATDGMALLFISHDIALAAGLADRIAVFRHGQMMEIGAAAEVVTKPRAPYTRALLAAHIGLDAAPMLQRDGINA